jgi:hypothetical protein
MSRYTTLHFAPLLSAPLFALLTATICSLNAPAATAQEDAAIKNITSHLAESLSEDEDLSELTERLSFYKKKPIDLNHASAEQLKDLVFLSALQIGNLYRHIRTNGNLQDVLELQGIDEFDQETIRRLLPYVTVRAEPGIKGILNRRSVLQDGNNELILRYGQVLKMQKGFTDLPGSRYLGSPQKLLLKYKYHLGDLLSLSVTGDKDAGEGFFSRNSRSGFDFLSASLGIYKNGAFRKIIIGDYSLQFGQGLSLWTGSSFGKGADVAGVAKKDTGIKPYTSANEFSFFRGIGTTVSILEIIDLTTFISCRELDTSLSSSTDADHGETKDDERTLITIGMSGLHRTPAEIRNKGSLRQLLYGSVFQLRKSNLEAGLIAYHSRYNHEFTRGKALYRRYSFEGKELSNLGLYYNYNLKNIYLFGETAKSEPGGFAVLNGAMTSISRSLSAVILYRNYAKDHHTFYSQGLGAGSTAANEKGWYGGIHFSRGKRWDFSLYADLFNFPWAKYRVDSASSGADLMGLLNYVPKKELKFMLKFNLRLSEQNLRADLPLNPLAKVEKENLRLACSWQVNKKIKIDHRIEITKFRKGAVPATYGYMILQDADYSPLSSRLAANIRFAFFKTDSYENRIYAYEDDVLYGAGSGLYNGRGFRTFLNMNYRLSRNLKAWARYALYYYPGKEKTGSGLDEIRGNSKPEIKLQLRYQF